MSAAHMTRETMEKKVKELEDRGMHLAASALQREWEFWHKAQTKA